MPAIPSPPNKATLPKITGRGMLCYFYCNGALVNQGRMRDYPKIGDWIGIGQTTYVIEKLMWTMESTSTKVISITYTIQVVPPVPIHVDEEPTREEAIP